VAERISLAGVFRPYEVRYDAAAGLEPADRIRGQQDAGAQAGAVGAQDCVALRVLKRTDDPLVLAFQDTHDRSALAVADLWSRVGPGDHPVTVPAATQLIGGNEQVIAT